MGFESWPSFHGSSKISKDKETPSREHNQEMQNKQHESDLYKRARMQFSGFFDEYHEPNERMAEILKRVEPFFHHIDKKVLSEETAHNILTDLSACTNISDKQQFLDAVMNALKPALEINSTHAAKFEEAQAHAMNEAGGFTEINRLLSYGKSGSTIHIHAPAGKTVDKKLTLYRDGMKTLAEIVYNDPDITEITASSPLSLPHMPIFL